MSVLHYLDTTVIGGGQAGLALGYYLAQQGRNFVILDAGGEVGEAWRNRWDSLKLFTPSQYDALPGLPFPKPADTYPSKDEVADYLVRYAKTFKLPIRFNSRVVSLKREGTDYLVETETACFITKRVVIATGAFHQPFVPVLSSNLADTVFQLHSADYKSPATLPIGEVLVVGAGNSGMQIALELAASRKVTLSRGRPLPVVPTRLLGKSLFWWLETFGVTRVTAQSALGKRMRKNADVVIGSNPDELVRSRRLVLVPRAVRAEENKIGFADGQTLDVRTVIWATGYRSNYDWIDIPVFDADKKPVHQRGVTAVPGMYFLGLPWQHTTGSALLGFVKRDAAFTAKHLSRL